MARVNLCSYFFNIIEYSAVVGALGTAVVVDVACAVGVVDKTNRKSASGGQVVLESAELELMPGDTDKNAVFRF